jgi:hypothetical protein
MADQLRQRLADELEIRIRTRSADGTVHRAIIWPIVDEADRILVRSYRGASARWFREATSGRPVEIEMPDGTIAPVEVEDATDPARVAACSAGFEAKYAGDPATPAMVDESVLDTTLELRPIRSIGS